MLASHLFSLDFASFDCLLRQTRVYTQTIVITSNTVLYRDKICVVKQARDWMRNAEPRLILFCFTVHTRVTEHKIESSLIKGYTRRYGSCGMLMSLRLAHYFI